MKGTWKPWNQFQIFASGGVEDAEKNDGSEVPGENHPVALTYIPHTGFTRV